MCNHNATMEGMIKEEEERERECGEKNCSLFVRIITGFHAMSMVGKHGQKRLVSADISRETGLHT